MYTHMRLSACHSSDTSPLTDAIFAAEVIYLMGLSTPGAPKIIKLDIHRYLYLLTAGHHYNWWGHRKSQLPQACQLQSTLGLYSSLRRRWLHVKIHFDPVFSNLEQARLTLEPISPEHTLFTPLHPATSVDLEVFNVFQQHWHQELHTIMW